MLTSSVVLNCVLLALLFRRDVDLGERVQEAKAPKSRLLPPNIQIESAIPKKTEASFTRHVEINPLE